MKNLQGFGLGLVSDDLNYVTGVMTSIHAALICMSQNQFPFSKADIGDKVFSLFNSMARQINKNYLSFHPCFRTDLSLKLQSNLRLK